ncbi:hypothetical protein D9758_000255 [Tetrapyrgos nigripes]|uniref:Uncharacterized protein n=1 Tax=Tetrapyrgos nigripes TaxID=182062 RepID=A0A8H5H1S6_9AGAR|nr:hypothetical protein D9758_000255 [Tetrapyrgos nigripes]
MGSPNIFLRLLCLAGLSSIVFQAASARSHADVLPGHHRVSTIASRHPEPAADNVTTGALDKRGGDRFTWYGVGLGACGGTNVPTDFIVALNAPQWNGGSHCWEMITISYKGQSTQAQIVDLCPGCPPSGLDLSHGLFAFLSGGSPEQIGVILGDWSFGGGDPDPEPKPKPPQKSDPMTTSTKPPRTHTSTSAVPTIITSETTSTIESHSTTTSSSPSPSASEQPQLIQLLDAAIVQLGGVVMAGLTVQSDSN